MINKISTAFICFVVACTLAACSEIIDININAADPQMVVEATVGLNENAKVRITKSIGLDELDNYTGVENAKVTLTDNEGNTEVLTASDTAGIYISRVMTGVVGRTYTLDVRAENEVITGESKIPNLVPVDSVKILRSIYPGGGAPISSMQDANFIEISIFYTDPIAEANYYRYLLYINRLPVSGNRIANDQFNNGNHIETKLILYNPGLKTGDIITVEVQCIDKSVYAYFKSMGSAGGPGGSSSPANPYSNLSGTLLGYFSAHTVERRDFVVQ